MISCTVVRHVITSALQPATEGKHDKTKADNNKYIACEDNYDK